MERKGIIIGAALAVGALALGVWLASGDESASSGRIRAIDRDSRDRPRSFGSQAVENDDREARPAPMPPSGEPARPIPSQPLYAPAIRAPQGAEESEESLRPPRLDPHADRSSGWRLGRARAQITLVESRVAALRERVSAFEAQGDGQLAERQRMVLTRFENRLTQLRQEEATLQQEATADGTIGEVELGIRENTMPERPIVGAPRAPQP